MAAQIAMKQLRGGVDYRGERLGAGAQATGAGRRELRSEIDDESKLGRAPGAWGNGERPGGGREGVGCRSLILICSRTHT